MDIYLFKAISGKTKEPVEGFLEVIEYKENDYNYEEGTKTNYIVEVGGHEIMSGTARPFVCKAFYDNGHSVRLYQNDEVIIKRGSIEFKIYLSSENIIAGDFKDIIEGDYITDYFVVEKPRFFGKDNY